MKGVKVITGLARENLIIQAKIMRRIFYNYISSVTMIQDCEKTEELDQSSLRKKESAQSYEEKLPKKSRSIDQAILRISEKRVQTDLLFL